MTTSEITSAVAANPDYARLQLGTAPDSWGIWFPDDPQQPHWSVFLDEVVEAGFRTIELGPFGYLPTNPEQLTDELGKRGLSLTAGTVGAATHRGHDAFEASRRDAFEVCELLAAMDVEAPGGTAGDVHRPADRRTQPAGRTDRRAVARPRRRTEPPRPNGQGAVRHSTRFPPARRFARRDPAVHRHVPEDTDPSAVALCLDTGHVEYCAGDNREIVRRHPDRISYIHLKQVNPAVAAKARADRVGFYEAVQRGAMVEPPLGAPDMKPLLDDLAALNRDLRLIIEQDMYPAKPGNAKAIATRTRQYFTSIGLLPAEH